MKAVDVYKSTYEFLVQRVSQFTVRNGGIICKRINNYQHFKQLKNFEQIMGTSGVNPTVFYWLKLNTCYWTWHVFSAFGFSGEQQIQKEKH